jgi:MFS family permease
LFATFNALSFQVVLGSPMILYGRHLGASATVLGIIAGMMPLLVIFQIPAAQFVNRVGYKKFVYAGWGTRVAFIFGMALVPLTSGFLNATARLSLLLMLLFGFNLSRGISSAAWLPWITTLVPASIRGRYLATDAGVTNLASFVAFLVTAACLGSQPDSWRFSVIFGFSALMGATSLAFLKRIPDVELPENIRTSREPVPWGEIVRYSPFRKLVAAVVVWSVAYGGMSVFSVAFLKVMGGLEDGKILLMTSVSFLGGLSSLWFLGSRLDALGSRPVLCLPRFPWDVVAGGWLAIAGGVLMPGRWLVMGLQLFMGLLAALMSMANLRLAMAIIPEMGRNHFFAAYTVLGSVALGLAPIGWGIMIDAIGGWHVVWMGIDWNRYTLFFGATALAYLAALGLAARLEEPEAASMEALLKEILIQSPQRLWVRLWPRG